MATGQTLSFGCALYDRTAPLKDGRVKLDGYDIDMRHMSYGEITAAAFGTNELDIAEISTSTLIGKIDGGVRSYSAVPAFLSMCFRHDCILVRTDSAFEKPEDLNGKRIGVPEFYGTTSIWLRGMMQDLHGVDFRRNRWVVGPVEGSAGVLTQHHPDNVLCDYVSPGKCLSDLLVNGEIDAVFAHRMPAAFLDGRLRRLYRDVRAAETSYYRATGHIPLLHVAGVKNERLKADPMLVGKLFAALTKAKELALADIKGTAVYNVSLPHLARAVDEARSLIGDDFWPYGIEKNKASIDALLRYCHEQGLSKRLLQPADLFASA